MSGLPRDFGRDLAVTCPRPDCARPPGVMCVYVTAPAGCGHQVGDPAKTPHAERRKLGRLVRERELALAGQEEAVRVILADREKELGRMTRQAGAVCALAIFDRDQDTALRDWLRAYGEILWSEPSSVRDLR